MFESIRQHKKYLMGFLMILIIPSFVLFGVEGYSNANEGGETVATVKGQDIKQAEWDAAHQAQIERLQQAMPTIDIKLLDTPEARYAALETLVQQRVMALAAQELRIVTSDQRLQRDLQSNEVIASLRLPDGKLDIEAYRALLARQGMTPDMFENQVRQDLSVQQITQGVLTSGFTTPAAAAAGLKAFFERRQVRVAPFTAAQFAAQAVPTDADLQSHYQNNAAAFQTLERADVEYVVLDAQAMAQDIRLNEADVRAYFEQNTAQWAGAEERRASHILFTLDPKADSAVQAAVKQKAEAVLAEVRQQPERFAALAKQHSQDLGSAAEGGDLNFFGRNAMVKAFEDVAFSLNKGQISDLVQTDFGWHIIRVTDIKEPPKPSFEALRAQIEDDLKKQQAQRLFAEAAETFTNMVYEQADSLQPVAERFKLTVQTQAGLTRRVQGDAGVWSNDRLLSAVFSPDSIAKKTNTEAVELGSGRLAAARIVRYAPAATQPFEQVKDAVRARWVSQRAVELAQAQGEQSLAAWKGGAAPTGLGESRTISRVAALGLSLEAINAVMSASAQALPAWVGVKLPNQGYLAIQVEQVLPAEGLGQAQDQQYAQAWTAAESKAYVESLKSRFKAQILAPALAAPR
ncbi:SurA Parvulin-like peptidyl-prolyl isomerase [Burkholderiaceae bacterium]